jgi:hypothetical protein
MRKMYIAIEDFENMTKGYSKGGMVSQMQRLRFAEGGRVGPNFKNPLINRVLNYNTLAPEEESKELFNTPEYKDQGFYGEVKDDKIFINRPLFESKGATGKWEEEFTLFESMHNLKHSAPEWYDRLYTAANKDPAVIKEKERMYSDAVQGGERRSIEDWWNEAQFDQTIAAYLFAGKDSNLPSMREWTKEDAIFGTELKKELEAFEEALGRGKRESYFGKVF